MTNHQGNVEQVLDYKPFGGTRVNEKYGSFDERRKYTGHELDDETGLYYAQARYYDPEIGRFVSQDPLQWRVGELMERFAEQPQALNFYSYVGNNPIIKLDPRGEYEQFQELFRPWNSTDSRTNGAMARDYQRTVNEFKQASKDVAKTGAATAASSAVIYLGATNPQAAAALIKRPETVGALMNTAERAYYDYEDDGVINDELYKYGISTATGALAGSTLEGRGILKTAVGTGIFEASENYFVDGEFDPASTIGSMAGAGMAKSIFNSPVTETVIESNLHPAIKNVAEGLTELYIKIETTSSMINNSK